MEDIPSRDGCEGSRVYNSGMRRVWQHLHRFVVPSHHNDFHPHLIAERGLLILFAVILGAEAFLVSHVISVQPGVPSLAAVGEAVPAQGLSPVIAELSAYWMKYVLAPLVALALHPDAGRWAFIVLIGVAVALMALVAVTLSMRRRRFLPATYMAGGTMLAFAVTLVFYNTHVFLPYAAAQYQVASAALAFPELVMQVAADIATSSATSTDSAES